MPESRPDISFESWRYPVQQSPTPHRILLVVAEYMGSWTQDDLARIPELARLPPRDAEELSVQSLELSRAELTFDGDAATQARIREMALVISCAAARMRYLKSVS